MWVMRLCWITEALKNGRPRNLRLGSEDKLTVRPCRKLALRPDPTLVVPGHPAKRGLGDRARTPEPPPSPLPLLWPRKGENGCETWGLCAESHVLSAHLKSLHASVPSAPISAQAWPYRTSALRRLPAGSPESRAAPGFLRHGRGKWKAGWVRTQWVSGLGRPLALRQSLHPAAQTAEEIGGGGGREQRRRGEGSEKARRRGGAGARKLVVGRWGRRVCGEKLPGREGDESWRRREQRVRGVGGEEEASLGRFTPALGQVSVRHLGGPLCPILCQLPTPDVFILAASTGSASSPQWETLPAQ